MASAKAAKSKVGGICREVLNGRFHTKERRRATWCDHHAEQRRLWREAKKSTDRRGQPAADWIPLPVSEQLKHTEFKVPSPAWLDDAHQRLLHDVDQIDRAVTNLQTVIARAKPVPQWLSDTTGILQAASERMRAELSTPR